MEQTSPDVQRILVDELLDAETLQSLEQTSTALREMIIRTEAWRRLLRRKDHVAYRAVFDKDATPAKMHEYARQHLDVISQQPDRGHTYWKRYYEYLVRMGQPEYSNFAFRERWGYKPIELKIPAFPVAGGVRGDLLYIRWSQAGELKTSKMNFFERESYQVIDDAELEGVKMVSFRGGRVTVDSRDGFYRVEIFASERGSFGAAMAEMALNYTSLLWYDLVAAIANIPVSEPGFFDFWGTQAKKNFERRHPLVSVPLCASCGRDKPEHLCGLCDVHYCSEECADTHWEERHSRSHAQ